MVRTLLVRGMLVGLVAGVLAFGFASLFGESPIDQAIAFEGAHVHGADGPELVSRAVQSTFGLLVAVGLYGAALGGVFALAFAFVYGRLGQLAARATSVLVAAVGFVAVYLVPFVKYPANPPAVGHPDTIGRRSTLYLLMVLISVLAVAGLVLPRIDEVAGDFPATVLWRFRLASVGTQLVLWTTFGLLFGALTERSLRRRAAAAHVVPAG